MDWDAWMDEVGLAKAAFARLIGAEPDEIAVFSSVSEATSAVASALDFTGATQQGRRHRGGVSHGGARVAGAGAARRAARGCRCSDGRIDLPAYEPLVTDRTAIVSGVPRLLSQRLHAGPQGPERAGPRPRRAALRRRLPDRRRRAHRREGARRRLPRLGQSQVPHGHSRHRLPLRAAGAGGHPAPDGHRVVRPPRALRLSDASGSTGRRPPAASTPARRRCSTRTSRGPGWR